VAAATDRAPRAALLRADTLAAQAGLALARQFENPLLAASYSESTPRQHYVLEVPLDLPWVRASRIGAARASRDAALLRARFDREGLAFGADTLYTRATARQARAATTRRTARDADSLVALATVRRDAGDGTELDVALARVNAAQAADAAATDSADAETTLLELQLAIGMPGTIVAITLSDPLTPGALPFEATTAGTAILLAAAESDAQAADAALALERRRVVSGASLAVGFETRDPGGTEGRTLPTIGITVPVPLFNQNRAAVQAATALRDRAQATLALARIALAADLATARRTLAVAEARAARSGRLLPDAQRVEQLSLLAYREGATTLPSVLEAQRTARETVLRNIEDVAAARNAAGLVRLLTLTVNRTDR
jgi:cobalt-zinc-cadmium efflux system outer membrane protein